MPEEDLPTPPWFLTDPSDRALGSGSISFRADGGVLDMTYLGNSVEFDCAGLDKVNFKVVSVDSSGYPAGGVLAVDDTINGEDWDALSGATDVTSTGSTQTQSALTCQGKRRIRRRVKTAASGSRLLVSFTGYKTS